MRDSDFEIRHFAGNVLYDSTAFLEKNRDKLFDHLEELLAESTNVRFKQIMQLHSPSHDHLSSGSGSGSAGSSTGGTKSWNTLASRFQDQLNQLMAVLGVSDPHFVRCIKPNGVKAPSSLDVRLAAQQLRYSGVLEAIQIRKSGYPIRRTHVEFRRCYWVLSGYNTTHFAGLNDAQKCKLVIKGLASKNPAFADIKMGRTLVFFRPEALSLLEQQKIRIGLKAIIFIQSLIRKACSMRRFVALCEARQQINDLMKRGRLRNRSNLEALEPLQEMVRYSSHDLQMICFILKDAKVLIERLSVVKKCRDRMLFLLDNERNVEINPSTQHFRDVLEEYEAIQKVIKDAEDESMDIAEIIPIKKRRELLKDRAEALLALRNAIRYSEEDSLRAALREVSILQSMHGKYCEVDEAEGQELLKHLNRETFMIDELTKLIRDFQGEYKSKLQSSAEALGLPGLRESSTEAEYERLHLPESEWDWFEYRVQEVTEAIHTVLLPFVRDPPVAPIALMIFNIIRSMSVMLEKWVAKDWVQVANSVREMITDSSAITGFNKPVSRGLKSRGETVSNVVTDQVGFIRKDLERYMVLPTLEESLRTGRLHGKMGHLDAILPTVDARKISDTVKDIFSLGWIGFPIADLLKRADIVSRVRHCCIDSNWEDILHLTQSEAEGIAYKERQAKLAAAFEPFHAYGTNSSPKCSGENWTAGAVLTSLKDARNDLEKFHTVFRIIAEAMEDELLLARQEAFDRVCAMRIEAGSKLGRAEGTVGTIRIDRVDPYPLEVTLNELETFETKNPSFDLSEDTAFAKRSCQSLCEIRRRILEDKWSEMSRAIEQDAVSVALLQADPENFRPHIRNVIFVMKDEMARIQLEALNIAATLKLSEALICGRISGSVGNVYIGAVNKQHIDEGLAAANKCMEGEYSGMSASLKSSVILAKAISVAREAFKLGSLESQKESLTAFMDMSVYPECPPETKAEIELMRLEVDYRECIDTLKRGLKNAPPVQYFIPIGDAKALSPRGGVASSKASPSDTTLFTSETKDYASLEIDKLLHVDGFMRNNAALTTSLLKFGLEAAEAIDERIGDAPVPDEFGLLIRTAAMVKIMRDCCARGIWEDAFVVLRQMQSENIAAALPLVAAEVAAAEEPICNYLNTTKCIVALSRGQFSGDIGHLHEGAGEFDKLEGAISSCASCLCTYQRAKALHRAAQVVLDLRRSVQESDWAKVRLLINQALREGIGMNESCMAAAELARVRVELENHEIITAMTQAMVAEKFFTKQGLLDLTDATVERLVDAQARAALVKPDECGKVLRELMILGEKLLKARFAALERSWTALEEILPACKLQLDVVNGLVTVVPPKMKKTMDIVGGVKIIKVSSGFHGFFDAMEEELEAFAKHLMVLELEGELLAALEEGGMNSEMVGCIDLSQIKTNTIVGVLQKKQEMLAERVTLPPKIETLCEEALIILSLRSAILDEAWDTLPILIQQAALKLSAPISGAAKKEINAIREEAENRWIITNVADALQLGRLSGTLGSVRLSDINCEPLIACLNESKRLSPRTEVAKNLIYTVEVLLPLRMLLCDRPVNWHVVRECAENLLSAVNTAHLDASALPEIRMIVSVAEDEILIAAMQSALQHGAVQGQPGNLDLSALDVTELDAACEITIGMPARTEKAHQLLAACHTLKSIRQAVLRTREKNVDVIEAWTFLRQLIATVFEARKKNHKDASWAYCFEEILLVAKETHLVEVRINLEESTRHASRVYAYRQNMSLGEMEESNDREMLAISSSVADLTVKDLDRIFDMASHLDFESAALQHLLECIKKIKLIRSAIMKQEWRTLWEIVSLPETKELLSELEFTRAEFDWAVRESNSRVIMDVIQSGLSVSPTHRGDVDLHCAPPTQPEEDHKELAEMIIKAETMAVMPVSVAARQFLECAQQVLQMRRGLSVSDSAAVASALRWFKANAVNCPIHIQIEAQRTYVIHQNNVLEKALTKALSTGKATGKCGNLDVSTIDVATLSKLLEQSENVSPQFDAVRVLLDAAGIALALRTALKVKDLSHVRRVLRMLAEREEEVSPIIHDELDLAQEEVENETVITTLIESLQSFDDCGSRSLDLSLASSGTRQLVQDLSLADPEVNKEEQERRKLEATRRALKRYSFANINNADIDLDTIDVAVLDEAIATVDDYTLRSAEAKRLYHTTVLVRNLRAAMKSDDWPQVERILEDAHIGPSSTDESVSPYAGPDAASVEGEERELYQFIDMAAEREIQVVRNQLQMRAAIVHLTKLLRTGWATCCRGLVDISEIVVDELADAIAMASKSMVNLRSADDPVLSTQSITPGISAESLKSPTAGRKASSTIQSASKSRTDHRLSRSLPSPNLRNKKLSKPPAGAKSKVQRDAELLLASATIVYNVRGALAKGEITKGGLLAEQALTQPLHSSTVAELQLYNDEINAPMRMLKLCSNMSQSIMKGDVETLKEAVKQAFSGAVHAGNDLGMIRILEKAEYILDAHKECRRRLLQVKQNFDGSDVQQLLNHAAQLKLSGPLVENAFRHLSVLKDFETFVTGLRNSNGGVLTTEAPLNSVLHFASELGMIGHPWAQKASVALRLSPRSFRTLIMHEAVAEAKAFIAATETIRLKREFLSQPGSQIDFSLDSYPFLNKPIHNSQPESFLSHTSGPIEMPLTRLPPEVAALSVWIFSNCVQPIERQTFSRHDTHLQSLILAGRACPALRDEILLQLIKQLRHNENPVSCDRLWRAIGACLFYFPPSRAFESFLEHFFLGFLETAITNTSNLSPRPSPYSPNVFTAPPNRIPPAVRQCIRLMHESIFTHGQDRVIDTPCDTTLRTINQWMSDLYTPQLHKLQRLGGGDVIVEPTLIDDPAFIDLLRPNSTPRSARSRPIDSAPVSRLRGSRDDWKYRFHIFLGLGDEEMSREDFIRRLLMDPPVGDVLDHDVLQALVFGVSSRKFVTMAREVRSSLNTIRPLCSLSREEVQGSRARRKWLYENYTPPQVNIESPQPKAAFANTFWDRYIVGLRAACSTNPRMRWWHSEQRSSRLARSQELGEAEHHESVRDIVSITWLVYRDIILTGLEICTQGMQERHNSFEISASPM